MIKDLNSLKGKTALVTGSSQGIGKAIALGLAEMGADIIVHYRTEKELARKVVSEIEEFNVKSESIQADLADPETPEKIFEKSKELFGSVDILVLNASVQIRKKWQDISMEEFDLQVNVNIRSNLMLMQKFIPHMQEQHWGKILTIGSVQQKRPHPDMLVYSASKSAVANMVKSLAVQLAPFGVNINNLAPGTIGTARNEEVLKDPFYFEKAKSKIPIGYIAEAQDCAGLAVLLCTDAGRYITGEDIFIDGGMSIPF
ncbi:MAG: SDR family oxidoreductase [Bacteroidales bacterium]|nr:SDR family oxidoreductase [Bacteroidales bacterium]